MTGGELMSDPCTQKETILTMSKTIEALSGASIRSEAMMTKMMSEFTLFSSDIRSVLLDGREVRTRMEAMEKSINIAFDQLRSEHRDWESAVKALSAKHDKDLLDAAAARAALLQKIQDDRERCKEAQIDPLWEWKDRTEGKFSTIKYVPTISAILAGLVFLISLIHEASR